MEDFIRTVSIYALPVLLGAIFHEVAHGWVADKLGDPTARLMGRISLNPLVHIDLFGTILLPLTLVLMHSPFVFGWAKPVPVDFNNLRGGRRAMALVTLAGPLTNLLLAGVSATIYHLLLRLELDPTGFISQVVEPIEIMARISVVFNVVLAVFNLLPIPPLDGGHILMGLLPEGLALHLARLERFGMLFLLILFATNHQTHLFEHVMYPAMAVLLEFLLG
jgi:Zn-dependent protease